MGDISEFSKIQKFRQALFEAANKMFVEDQERWLASLGRRRPDIVDDDNRDEWSSREGHKGLVRKEKYEYMAELEAKTEEAHRQSKYMTEQGILDERRTLKFFLQDGLEVYKEKPIIDKLDYSKKQAKPGLESYVNSVLDSDKS